mgnify:CR=1 FL=1
MDIVYFQSVQKKFRDNGLEPKIFCESPNVDMLLGLINEGLGATVVPKSTLLKHNTSNVRVLQLEDTHIVSESAIIWLKDRYLSKSAEQFIELFEKMDKSLL